MCVCACVCVCIFVCMSVSASVRACVHTCMHMNKNSCRCKSALSVNPLSEPPISSRETNTSNPSFVHGVKSDSVVIVCSGQLVPKYYYVDKEHMEIERSRPGSQPRIASPEGTTGGVFLWGQSLYIVAQLLSELILVIITRVFVLRKILSIRTF